MNCQSCDAVFINGILCHEHGCPDSWKNNKNECPWCGNKFVPEEKGQRFCDDGCAEAYLS